MPSILVVDDNALICQNLRTMLEDEGMDVVTFQDPLSALEYCRMSSCDLAIVDIRMPHMDGFELIQKMRSIQPKMRTLMISSHYDDDESVARAIMRRHCDAAFSKPFSLKQILISVLGLLAEPICASAAA
mgnify:CR=1 FL=1